MPSITLCTEKTMKPTEQELGETEVERFREKLESQRAEAIHFFAAH